MAEENNPIRYSDLIQADDSIDKLVAQLENLQSTFTRVSQSVKAEAAQMAASLKSVSGATEEGRRTTREAATDADRLARAQKDLAFAESETARQVMELKEQQKKLNMDTKLEVQLANAAAGSYNALSAQYRINKIALNNLSAEMRKTDPAARQLEEDTRKIYEQMNELQKATGKFSLNVGNYENSITSALGIQTKWLDGMKKLGELFEGGFTNGVKTAGTAVKGFGQQMLALLANPIVATIAAITAAFMALAKGISTSEENTMALERVLAPFQRILTGVVNVLQMAAEWLLKGVEGMEKLAMGASRLMEKLPLVGNAIKKVNDALADNIELTKRKQLLDIAERNNSVEQAKLARDVAKIRNNAAKESDPRKRAMLLSNAVALEHRIMLNEIALAKEDLAIKQAQAKQAGNNKETNDALAAAQARLYKAEENYYSRTLRMQKQITSADSAASGGRRSSGKSRAADNAEKEAKELERIRKESERKELQAVRQAEDAKVALMENEYDRERAQTILNYDRQIEDLRKRLETEENLTVEAKKAMNDTIISLEQQKWNKLSDIADKQMKASLDAEQRDYEQRIKATDQLVKKKEAEARKQKDIYDLLGFKLNDEQKAAIDESMQYALDSLTTFMDAYVAAAERKKELADTEVERARDVLAVEIEARQQGYANEVETARKELEEAKRNQQKALREQERAQRAQEAIDTATQVSSLITASANIWKSLSSVPYVGTALALAAIAVMWGSFAASKVMAHQVAGSGTEKYGEGTVELLQGGSHQSGNDIDLGRKKDGTRRRAEGGEYFAVINRRSSRKYRDLVPEVINSLNDGTFAEKYMGAYGGDVSVSVTGNGEHLRSLSDNVRQIREQGENRIYTDAKGNTVTRYKNITRIIRPS